MKRDKPSLDLFWIKDKSLTDTDALPAPEIIIAAEIGGQQWGNYVHESAVISLLSYVPVIVGLLFVGWWLEKKSGPNEKSQV